MLRSLGLLIFPGFQLLDAAGPLAAFEIAGRYGEDGYALSVLAMTEGEVKSSAGVTMNALSIERAPPLDTLVVAGGSGAPQAAAEPAMLAFIRLMKRQARRVASVCSGTYLLAEAGLLDGKRATTHWNRSADFASRFPKVRLEADRIFVRDGAVWSSAGITAGIDLALALIAEDLGESIARRTAAQLVVYRRRPGRQSQFSALLEMESPEGRFGPLLEWARGRLTEPLSVEQLAGQAAMSPRNFARRFREETGSTPARAIERLRVEAAREWIEAGQEPVEEIARRVGFRDPDRMRRAFLRVFGQPPQALRRAAKM